MAGRELVETGVGAEVLGLSEHFAHLFSQDHGKLEFPVISEVIPMAIG